MSLQALVLIDWVAYRHDCRTWGVRGDSVLLGHTSTWMRSSDKLPSWWHKRFHSGVNTGVLAQLISPRWFALTIAALMLVRLNKLRYISVRATLETRAKIQSSLPCKTSKRTRPSSKIPLTPDGACERGAGQAWKDKRENICLYLSLSREGRNASFIIMTVLHWLCSELWLTLIIATEFKELLMIVCL